MCAADCGPPVHAYKQGGQGSASDRQHGAAAEAWLQRQQEVAGACARPAPALLLRSRCSDGVGQGGGPRARSLQGADKGPAPTARRAAAQLLREASFPPTSCLR
jgi:hypothetical protein